MYSPVQYTGDGNNRNFAVPFQYVSSSYIKVYVGEVLQTAYTFLNKTTIQFTDAPALGAVVTIKRNTPIDVPLVVFTGASSIKPVDLDKVNSAARHAIEEASYAFALIAAATDRAFKVPEGELAPALPSASARANKVLAFDASGLPTPITGIVPGGYTVSETPLAGAIPKYTSGGILNTGSLNITRVADKAALQALDVTKTNVCHVQYAVAATPDRYQGVFVWHAGDYSARVTEDTSRAIFVPSNSNPTGSTGCWIRDWDWRNVESAWFGVKDNSTANQTAQLAPALTYCAYKYNVRLPSAVVLNAVTLPSGTHIDSFSTITVSGTSGSIFSAVGTQDITLRHLTGVGPATTTGSTRLLTISGNASHVRVHDCNVENMTTAMRFDDATDIQVTDCQITDGNSAVAGENVGIRATNIIGLRVINTTFTNLSSGVLLRVNVANLVINACSFENILLGNGAINTLNGTYILTNAMITNIFCKNVTVIDTASYGVITVMGIIDGLICRDVIVNGSNCSGLRVVGATGATYANTPSGSIFSNFQLKGMGNTGVFVQNVGDCAFSDFYIDGCVSNGLHVSAYQAFYGNTFTNFTIVNSGSYGLRYEGNLIVETPGFRNDVIRNMRITGSATQDYWITGDKTLDFAETMYTTIGDVSTDTATTEVDLLLDRSGNALFTPQRYLGYNGRLKIVALFETLGLTTVTKTLRLYLGNVLVATKAYTTFIGNGRLEVEFDPTYSSTALQAHGHWMNNGGTSADAFCTQITPDRTVAMQIRLTAQCSAATGSVVLKGARIERL